MATTLRRKAGHSFHLRNAFSASCEGGRTQHAAKLSLHAWGHLADHQSSFFFGSKCPPTFKSENLKLLNCESVAQKLSKTYGTHPAQQANLAPVFSDHWASLLIWCSCRTCQVPFEFRWEKMTLTNEECKVHKQNKQDLSTLRCVTNPCHGSTSASVQSYFVQVVS